ncbi:hypothetical protein FUAX_43000 (plasmid) [Fulvitalea axinellae]|uniref:Pr6Pr family membrane protein n=2 Tax=Fulvitalea axinellae TaxID=1182444 RepID=A0AAU9CV05_9BACT|nr:hypothetical protein FUAX_43000 [Fulvitalea axinellae]
MALGAILTWATLLLQLYISVTKDHATIYIAPFLLLRFFTIVGNLCVALFWTLSLLGKRRAMSKFFGLTGCAACVASYITLVMLGYALLLQHAWNPQGLELLAERLLHAVIPPLFIVYWFIFEPKEELDWKSPLRWTPFLLVYYAYSLTLSSFIGKYPYPFFDVNKLGWGEVFGWAFVLWGLFIAIGWFYTIMNSLKKR